MIEDQLELEPRPYYRGVGAPVMVPAGRAVYPAGWGWARQRSVNAPSGYGFYYPSRPYHVHTPTARAGYYYY